MRLLFAAGILAQALPTASSKSNGGVQSTRIARRERVHDLLSQKVEHKTQRQQQEVEEFQLRSEKRIQGGALKNAAAGSVECDPKAKGDADVGILGCGLNEFCMESEASSLGGICATQSASRRDGRHLQTLLPASVCDPASPDFAMFDCDCTDFDVETQLGMFSCTIYDYYCFVENYCGSLVIERSFVAGVESADYCYGFTTPSTVEVCYGVDTVPQCNIMIDGSDCDACVVINLPDEGLYGCYDFDCSNTLAGNAGNDCLGSYVLEGIFPAIFDTAPPSSVGATAPPSAASATAPPTGNSTGTEAPTGNSTGTEAPTGATTGTEAPTGATTGTEAPTGATTGTEAPTGAGTGTPAPTVLVTTMMPVYVPGTPTDAPVAEAMPTLPPVEVVPPPEMSMSMGGNYRDLAALNEELDSEFGRGLN